ncbi:hypothetical protein HELRODRAFT_80768, partial [Helobdella robusta]
LTGMCFVFLRSSNKKAITIDTISNDVNFMQVESSESFLHGFEKITSHVFSAYMKLQEKWGNDVIDKKVNVKANFLESVDKCVTSMANSKKSLNAEVTFPENACSSMLETMKSASEYINASKNEETIKLMEELLQLWCQRVKIILVESEQIRREADDTGPSVELVYWKNRMAKFQIILEKIRSPKCRGLVITLQYVKSKTVTKWREIDSRITDASNEAKDNVKYLSTLERTFKMLIQQNPKCMIEAVTRLMSLMRAIYKCSSYYNTPQRLTALLIKVTNQMIATCKRYMYQDVLKIWDLLHDELNKRINYCKLLKNEYINQFWITKQKIDNDVECLKLDLSENYVFGKFDAFCRQLEKIQEIISIIDENSGLDQLKMEGTEELSDYFRVAVDTIKKKTYDCLDFRKEDFQHDYTDFKEQMQRLAILKNDFINKTFKKNIKIIPAITSLHKFENISNLGFHFRDKFLTIMDMFSKDMDHINEIFEKNMNKPPIAKNMPRAAGEVYWCKQFVSRVTFQMDLFKKEGNLIKTEAGKVMVRKYNKLLISLAEFLYSKSRAWDDNSFNNLAGLNNSLLRKNRVNNKIMVNYDQKIDTTLREAYMIRKMSFEVNNKVIYVLYNQKRIRGIKDRLENVIKSYESLCELVPKCLIEVFKPYIKRIDNILRPGFTVHAWHSLLINQYLSKADNIIKEVEWMVLYVRDILQSRINSILADIASVSLCSLSSTFPVQPNQFLTMVENKCFSASQLLAKNTLAVEKSVGHILQILKKPLTEAELETMNTSDGKSKETNNYNMLIDYFHQKNVEAFVDCVRQSLEDMRSYVQTAEFSNDQSSFNSLHANDNCIFKVDLVLKIPDVVMVPSVDDVQLVITQSIQKIMKMLESIPKWCLSLSSLEASLTEVGSFIFSKAPQDMNNLIQTDYCNKSLSKAVSENKEIVKLVSYLNSIITTLKGKVDKLIKRYEVYSELWTKDVQTNVKEFMATQPSLSDFEAVFRHYTILEEKINEIESSFKIGPLHLITDSLKLGLLMECKEWKYAYGRSLNQHCSRDMDDLHKYFTVMQKRLNHAILDLEDIKTIKLHMSEIRDSEIKIEMTLMPIEEAFIMLNKYKLTFNDGNAEKVDALSYSWRLLKQQNLQVSSKLISVQPEFMSKLISSVETFKGEVQEFVQDYRENGPMRNGLNPHEASDRLAIHSAKFDEYWRKYTTYSGGEELFGFPVNEYPDLHHIRKELALLQKLYSLYNDVLEKVNGYNDIPWVEINIDQINSELLDFQNKCRKLPRALKEWQAYKDLRKTIDDFNATCPLLEMMASKSMQARHWNRIAQITGHTFEIDSDNFLLKNLMDAPLLANMEDIEDVCISAVKERDIEAKLKFVENEWSAQKFQFSTFKTRGELLLKGDQTVTLMEDSLMILGSLLGNRYNTPFKPKIQEWVNKLTTTMEIIENWLVVQNLWIYLEAVFGGGDIAKQLPQEAKRFSNIDKSWQKIMQRAHDYPNVVHCCTGDNTLSQLLPHLQEQLEICQKSLSGYLEKKRLLFPRFFFVSDPALLEILGQASDSHTVQAHLLSVFDNIKSVTFEEKQYDKITSIISQESEVVPLQEHVMAVGNVENWLGDLLKKSRRSVHGIICRAAGAIADINFRMLDFQNSYPAQVGLLGLQMIWTRDAETALQHAKSDKKIMRQTNDMFLEILNELIEVTTQDLSKIERTKYETLITIHVHQRDIFDDLCKLHIKSSNDFEWLKQARFYFKEDEEKCIVSITDVNFIYQNEYLGCIERLVITPLTDRCYITLAQALGMSLGGAPAGPAGTGKTETIKDMGRCLGKFVVVFNCSDQMDYRGLGRIYKGGLAMSGSWGCFDEFNRIELPALSVAAQQIAIILACKKDKKSQFTFTDGDIVSMDAEFGVFLTMNPGYAGRQELPENLKINFRSVAMMIPDRAIIICVKLASCGFEQNSVLSKKFYTLYKLCEEQLSKQVHYDFGLRNILSVLRTLGSAKRKNTDDSETTIVMRVLRDMNLSKLVDEDEPLFMSLIEDLFPGMTLEKANYPQMEVAIENQVKLMDLINHAPWSLKLIQLYETQLVRHGMMTLGPSGAGKTKCIHALMKAMTECGVVHREMRMNPKAITAPQMFGRLDVATNDWTDGIFSTLWRRTHKSKKGDHIWLVLDGPVDAIWIENLNSVLDDNKTLTLANGDRIPMSPTCKIIFEVHNIDNASPATVSRNGMVFMSSSILDYKPIVLGWLQNKPEQISTIILDAFNNVFSELYKYIVQTLNPKMEILECMYARQALDLLSGLISTGEDNKEISDSHLQKIIVFALMWSLGALLEQDDRRKVDEYMQIHAGNLPLPQATGDNTIFEYVVSDSGTWEHWHTRVPEYIYPKDSIPEYLNILVPNVDNIRTDFLIHTIAKQSKAVLLIGEQGSAKTVIIQGYCSKYNPDNHVYKCFNFSSASTPFLFQRTVESYVDKRMGTTYGPPAGKKMTIFVDDINMPVVNEWGDQVTNEITRQLMEMRGFYNLEKPGEFTNIVDIQLMAAMIHPGGGRNDIPQRLKRQFCIINCTIPANASIDKIFTTIGCGFFTVERGFTKQLKAVIEKLVPATRKLWQKTKFKMLPTPAKFHYIFNLRDLSRIWQGMLNASADVISSSFKLLLLWKHECCRVISDRFTMQEDKDWFEKTIKMVWLLDEENDFDVEPYFVDFLRDAPEVTGTEEGEDTESEPPKIYEPINSFQELSERLEMYQQQYNESIRGAKMDLVFFKDAMTNLVKISRVIGMPKGHVLLVGVGGSGKQSLTRLASNIAGYKVFQITLTRSYSTSNFMEDLKYLYRTAGAEGKGITFVFTDNEIKDEGFLEYMNNVLSSGEVSNLFARDEMDEMLEELVPIMKKEFPRRPPTNENLYNYYTARVKKNLHVVLCFSPVGEKFRSRSLKFPGLISGCTMDWFEKWPKDALVAVSKHFLTNYDLVCSNVVKQSIIRSMGNFQDSVSETCVEYFQRFRRQTHVTPKSYLSFISGYKTIYDNKRSEIGQLAERMNTGLMKLIEATENVNELSKELEIKEKELFVASKKADKVLAEVTVSAQAAEKVKAQVEKVKDKAQKIVDEISMDKLKAEEKLEAARPALEEAEAALQTIKPAHIATVRKLAKPPHLIMRIMDCVLLLFQRRVDPVTIDPDRPCPKPSWHEALKLMSATNILQGLLAFPKDTINEETVELLQPYLQMEDYNMESARKVCGDVAGLASWTQSMAYFYGINKEVLPLKANLAVQEARYEAAMKDLNKAQMQLDEKQAELEAVQAQYDQAMTEKQTLVDDANNCRHKMTTARALIDGLSGEKIRWTSASKTFESQIQKLVGDVLLATAFLSYAGPFNQEYRKQLVNAWKKELIENNIPYTDDVDVITMLVDNTTISEWSLQGLPSDELSIQNGLIVTKSARYPLLIDPQNQGKVWIKNREGTSKLVVTTLNHKSFRSHLEEALSNGYPLLIEDVSEELDPALDSLLEKNFIKSGSSFKVKVGDKEVDLHSGFRMYMTTKLANPAYTPEVSAKTSIIDFTVTIKGLEDQLLGIVILTEKKELEAERTKLIAEVTYNKRKMQELEDNLLFHLTSTKGSLVEDETLIEALTSTKETALEVTEKLSVAAETEIRINAAREEFRPVATRGSVLYFLIVKMGMVNEMYQTSLKQFLQLFDVSMLHSTKSPITHKRIQYIIDYLTYLTFSYTIRGLYEKDKFLFTLLLTLEIQLQSKAIHLEEFQCFIKGGAALDLNSVGPKPNWITDMTWLNLVELSKLPQFTQILVQVHKNEKVWKEWFDTEAPEESTIPDGYDDSLSTFHKLLLVRCWCPDRTIPMAKLYISEVMGKQFAEGVVLDMEAMWNESDNQTPMICFLSMGSDPTENIERLAKSKGISKITISMGQGQEVHARRLVGQSMSEGSWVLLHNCHLGLDYLDELLDTLTTNNQIHETFRCWITTDVHPRFPINLLQMSIKFTAEPPQATILKFSLATAIFSNNFQGVKANLKRTYGLLSQDQLDVISMPQWKPLLYAIAFLHTTVQERRKFGPIGWNIPYEFNQADFTSTIQFIQNHLDDIDPKRGVSWATVCYMIGEVQYGSRVTDDYDKRLLNTYAKIWFHEDMFSENFEFHSGYKIPKCKTLDDYKAFIDLLPMVDSPETFGLHPNADITYQTNTANSMLDTIVGIQPKDSSATGGETRESVVYRLADDMLSKLPNDYIPHEVKENLQKMGLANPLAIFLRQEVDRIQKVITAVRNTLQDLKLAIDGTIIMSENLRDALDCMFDARIPEAWRKISWDSATFGFWCTDLLDRNLQFNNWLFEARPKVFWMAGFFNPQGFLTAMRQEITRAHKGWALDNVVLDNEITKLTKEDVASAPAEGVYVYGLYLDGAGWDKKNMRLVEPSPKVLYTCLPIVHLFAINSERRKGPNFYEAPVYKKPKRTDLTYIFPVLLKTVVEPNHWITRGVALLCDTK